jgi:Protein of unknown function (DUF2934)
VIDSLPIQSPEKGSPAVKIPKILSREDVERRAFQLYMARGREPGQDLKDWLTAEKEMSEPIKRVESRASSDSDSRKAA